MTSSSDEIFDAVAGGIAKRVIGLEKAEEQFAAFAVDGVDVPKSGVRNNEYFVLRTLAVLGQRDTFAVVRRLSESGSMKLDEIRELMGEDRLAAVDVVSLLTQVGLATRQLDVDRIEATGLTVGVVEMVLELERRMQEEFSKKP